MTKDKGVAAPSVVSGDSMVPLIVADERRARAWEGLVRVMEANRRGTIQINLSEAQEVAFVMRSVADGRKQTAQAQVTASRESGPETRNESRAGAQENRRAHRLDTQEESETNESAGCARSDRLSAVRDSECAPTTPEQQP